MPVVLSHDSSNRGTKRIPTLHTCIYRLLISLLLLSFPLQSLAVSEVTLASAAPIIIQEGEQISISLVRSGTQTELSATTTVLMGIDGTGASGDFNSATLGAFFNAGETLATVVIAAVQDTVPEIDEVFLFVLRTALGSTIGAQNSLNITIPLNDEPYGVVSFSISSLNTSSPEPLSDADTDPYLVVERIGAFGTVNVNWRFLGDVSGDFLQSEGVVTFGDQIGSVKLYLPAVRDEILEPDEVFQVELVSVDGGARLSSTNTIASLTLIQNDIPVYLSCNQASVQESAGLIACEITRGLDSQGNQVDTFSHESTLTISTQSISATSQLDYLAISTSITLPSDTYTQSISVTILEDTIPEDDEEFLLTIHSPSSDLHLFSDSVTITIVGNDGAGGEVSLVDSQDPIGAEGDYARVTLIRTESTVGVVTVNWEVYHSSSNTSIATDDVSTPGTSSIPDGASQTTLLIPIISDGVPEAAERFSVQLQSVASNIGRLATSNLRVEFVVRDSDSAYGLIEWDETGHTITLSPRTLTLRMVRSQGLEFNILINYNVTYVPAGSGVEAQVLDYVTTPGFTVIQDGVNFTTIDLTIADNAFLEAQGRFYATVDSVSIVRTDTFPTLLVDPPSSPSIGPRDKLFIPIPEDAINGRIGFTEASRRVSVDEGTSSLPTNVTLTIVRDGSSGQATITYVIVKSTSSDTFSEEDLAQELFGTVVLPEGESSALLTVQIRADSIPELEETFVVTLVSAGEMNQQINGGSSSSYVTIRASDTPGGTISLSPTSTGPFVVSELTNDSVALTLVRTGALLTTEIVNYMLTSNGPSDFYASGFEIMNANEDTKVFLLIPFDDSIPELAEEFNFTIYKVSENAILGEPTQARITIRENDYPYGLFQLEDSSVSGVETGPNTSPYNTVQFRVIRDRGTFGSVSVDWAFSSATAGEDVEPTYGTLEFIEGEDNAVITVSILPDDIPEGAESLTLVLHSPTGGAVVDISSGQAQLSIAANDDPITFNSQILDVDEFQGSRAEVTITRGGLALDRATVKLRTIADTAVTNEDYVPYSDFLIVFDSGEREKIVSTGILDDNIPEIEERFYFVLYETTGDSVVHTPYNVSVFIAPNDDPNGIVSFHPTSLVVRAEEGDTIYLVIQRDRGTFGQLLITLSLVLNSTGHPGLPESLGDLTFSTDVSMQDGSPNTTVAVQVLDDAIPELEDRYYITISCPVFGFPPLTPGPQCASDNLTSLLTVAENDDPYGGYGWREDSLEVFVPEDLTTGAPISSRDRVLTLYQYGGTLASAELLWELTPSLLRDIPLLDLFFYGNPGVGVSIDTSRESTGTTAYLFSGQTDSIVTVPTAYHPSLQDISGGFTLSTFLRGTISPGYLLLKESLDGSAQHYAMKIRVSGSNSYIQYQYLLSSSAVRTLEAELPGDASNGSWSHVAVVHRVSPSREAQVYFRGSLLAIDTIPSGSIVADGGVLSVGAAGDGTEAVAGLVIQDTRVYYAALDISQIQSISMSAPSQDISPISGYATFSIGQYNYSIPTLSVRDDSISEPTEVVFPTLLNIKGLGRILPVLGTARLSILASDIGNGVFEFQSLQPVSLADESETASLVVSRSLSDQGGVYVHWSVYQSDGSTLATEDFTEATGSVLLADGQSVANLVLIPVDDIVPEVAENYIVSLTGLSGEDGTTPSTPTSAYYINSPPVQAISLRIEDNDSPYGHFQFDLSGIPVQDSQFIPAATQQPVVDVIEETVNISIQVVRAQGTAGDVTVEYFTSSLDAAGIGADRDYINTAGQLSFRSGERSQFLTVQLVDDSTPELSESFQVILSNANGVQGKPSLGAGSTLNVTIVPSDDAFGVFSFRSDSLSTVVTEETAGLSLLLQRGGGLLGDVTLYWSLMGSSGPTDIFPAEGTVYFGQGVASGTIELSIVPDQISEFLEMFQVQLVNVTGGARLSSLGDTTAAISIQASDYPYGLFSFPLGQRAVTIQEGDTFSLTINRQFGTTGDIRVNYSTSLSALSPASPNTDYTDVVADYVDFPSGVTTRMIQMESLQDDTPEADELFYVQLVAVQLLSAAQPGDATPMVESGDASRSEITISENDDARGVFSFLSTQLAVPEPASSFLYVQRGAGLFGVVAVRYTVTLVTAGLSDLSSLNGQITFPNGASLVALPLSVADDLNPEFDETFTVTLTSPSGGARLSSANTSAVVTISENDDIHGVFEFAAGSRLVEVEEPQSIPLSVELVLERFEGAEGVVRITWEAVLRGGLSAPEDVSPVSGELLFQTQDRSKTFSIQVLPDTLPEGLEFVDVMIASVTGGARAGDASTATIAILPNDAPHGVLSFNLSLYEISEEENDYTARIAIKREFGSLGDLQVTYHTSQLSILDLAFSDSSLTESYYFTGPQSLQLTDSQDQIQESDISGSTNPFGSCARLCLSSYDCVSLSHSTTICTLYRAVSSDTASTPSSRSYYEKITELTDPLRLSIANDGGDYTGTAGSHLVIQDGEDTGYIEIPIFADNIPELGEMFLLTLDSLSLLNLSVTNPMNIPSFGSPVESRVEITRSDFPNGLFRVSLAGNIHSLVIQENYTDLIIGTIYRDYGTIGTVSVHYSLVGTATSVQDFALAEATFVYYPGENQKPLSFFIEEDTIAEGDETIIIQLDTPTGGGEIISGVGSSVTVQIDANDNGGGIISFPLDSLASVVEEHRANPIRVIRKVGSAGQALVTWVLTGESAAEEFSKTSGTALFEDGLSYTYIYLVPVNDTVPETPQVYTLNITSVQSVDIAQTGGAILDPDTSLLSAVVTLAESDMPHGVVELASSQTEYPQGEGDPSTILVARKFGTIGSLRLYYQSEVGNLTSLNPTVGPGQRALASESDITAGIQSLLIPEGVTSLLLPVAVVDDNVPEFGEVFVVRLVSVELLDPPPYDPAALKPPTLGDNTAAEIYIPQNDGPQGILQFSFGNLYVKEDAGRFSVSIERVRGSYGPASCRVELTGVPSNLPIATRDLDYLFQSAAFSWADGELGSRSVEIEIIEDDLAESREALHIGVSEESPSGVLRGENATLTIVILGSDLGRGIFSIDPSFPEVSIVREGTTLLIPVLRSFSLLGEVLLQYRVLPSVLPADLSPAVGQAVFQDGQASGNIVLDIVADGIAELVEQFSVEILPPVSPEGTLLGDRTSVEVHVSVSDYPYGRFQVYLLQASGQMDYVKALVEEDAGLLSLVVERVNVNGAVSVDWELLPSSATSNAMGDAYTLSTTQLLSSGSTDWLSFYVETFQYAISVDGDYSTLYRWVGIYEAIQTLYVQEARSWHSFSWSNTDYLLVSSFNSSIELYQYNSTSTSYFSLQTMPQARVSHLHTFSADGQLYMFACVFSDVTGDTDTSSMLYEWDSSVSMFSGVSVQQLVTRGAKQALTFETDSSLYLIVANSYDSSQQTGDTSSTLYQWSSLNTRFERVSSIATTAASSLSLVSASDGSIFLLATNLSSLFVFSWSGSGFSSSQLFHLTGSVNGVHSALLQNVWYSVVSVSGGVGLQLYTLDSGVLTPTPLSATPTISSLGISPVVLGTELFLLTAVEGSDTPSLLLSLGRWREGADFFQRRGTLSYTVGQSAHTLLVQVYPDETPEVTEEFILHLSNPTNQAVVHETNGNITVRILTNDNAHGLVGFGEGSLSVVLPELSPQDTNRQQDFTLEVVRLGGTFGNVVVGYTVTGEGVEDVSPTESTITFMSGSNSTTLPIRVTDDDTIELSELAVVTLTEVVLNGNTDPDVSADLAAQIDPLTSSAAVTIQANDYPHGLLTFSASSRSVTVDETGNITSVSLSVIREYGLIGAINIEVTTELASTYPLDQQAEPVQDFSVSTSSISMSSGVSIATVTVSVLPDLTPEKTEIFWVRIVSASLVDESDRQGSLSDSPRPKNSSLEVAEVHIRANDEFRGILSFGVTLAGDGTLHVSESVGLLSIVVNRTSGNFGEIGASWRLEAITSAPGDLSPTSGTISYSEGDTYALIEFRVTDDTVPEMSSTFRIVLHSAVGGARLGDTELVVTIEESDDVHGLFYFAQGSESFSLQEPGENATQPSSANLVVIRDKGLLGEVTVSWEIESSASGDVTPTSGQLVYPENSTTADFQVSLVDDTIPELEVLYQVRLVSATNGGNIASVRSISYLYILPNDNPTGLISISPSTLYVVVAEGSSVQVMLVRTQGAFYRVSVQWRIVPRDGSVSVTQHFLTATGSAVFAISATTATIELQTITDSIPESAQLFSLELLSATIAGSNERPVIDTAADEATLLVAASDQPHGRIVFQSPVVSSYPEGAGSVLIPVARELGTVGRIRINFTVSALSSLPGQDYLLPQEYVLMEDGQTGTQINVTLVDDATPELNEVLQFSLTSVELLDPPEVITLPPGASNPGNVELNIPPILGGSTVHTLTIQESDYPYGIIEFSQSVYSVQEGQLAEIKVNRLRGTIGVQSVQFTIIEGRAKLGEDFVTGGGTLTGTLIFQEGSAVSYIQLQIIDDTTPEDTENLAVFLDSITGSAVFGTATSAEVDIEISDDPFGVIGFSDSSMLLEIRNPTVSEGDLSVSLTVDRVRGTMGSVEVQYQVIPTHPLQQVHQDVYPSSATLTFSDGVSQQFIILTILAQEGPEVEEEYIVYLAYSSGTLDAERVNASVVIAGRGMPYGVVGFAPGLEELVFEEPEVSVEVGLELRRAEGTFSSVLVYWEAVGNVASSDIDPLSGSVELPHWDGAVSAYPHYNLTFTLISDTQAENEQEFSIRLTGTSSLTTIDPTTDSVTIIIRANDYPHGVFSIDPASLQLTLFPEQLLRVLNFSIVRDQGLQSAATVSYSLSYTDYESTESIHLVAGSLVVSDGQMRYEGYITIRPSTFIGTRGNLTLSLTNVTAEGTAVTGLPPRIATQNDYAILTVLEHQANARISFSSSSLFPAVNDITNTVDIALERDGSFGNVTIGFGTEQTTDPQLTNGLITPGFGDVEFLPSDRTKSVSFSLSPNLLTSAPEIYTITLRGVIYSPVRADPSLLAGTAVVEPRGVVALSADQLVLRVSESDTFATLDVLRLFGSADTIFVSYSTESAEETGSMFEELAIAGRDYNTTQGLLRLDPLQTRQQIRVPIAGGDALPGVDKLFRVTLSAVVDSSGILSESPRLRVGYTTSVVIIVDDDTPAGVFSFSQNKLIVQEQFQLLVITVLRESSGAIFPANISVRTVDPQLGSSLGIDYSALGVNLETTDNATLDQDYLGLDEKLQFSVNGSVMQVSLRILDEDIPELDKLVLLQLYNASYHASISAQSLLPIVISANDDSGGVLRFSDSSLSLFISEDIMPAIQVGLSRDRGMFGRVSIQWQAKLSAGDTPATAEEISELSTQLAETSGIATFQAGASETNFTLSLKQDSVPELMSIFYLQLLADTIQPVAVLEQSRSVAKVTSLQSDFPYGAIQFTPDSRFRTISSTANAFTISLSIERIGGTLGYVLVNYNTPGITQESISIGSYIVSNAQIGSHYLSADGTLNFTEGRTLASIELTILGNILDVGETRLLYVDLVPEQPAEGGSFLRATVLLTGHGNEFRLLEIYSQQLSRAVSDLETSQSLLTFLSSDIIATKATNGESLIVRSILDQLITDADTSMDITDIQRNVFTVLSLVIGSGKFQGKSYFSEVVESFSFSLLASLPCPMESPVEMESSVIVIRALRGNASLLSGYQFSTNRNTFKLPSGVLSESEEGSCSAELFIADMSMEAGSLFPDTSIQALFGNTVLSVGLRDSNGEKVTALQSPVTYRVVSPGQVVKYKNSHCVFWDSITSRWSREGCEISNQLIEQPFVECRCTHLTNFAADASADSRYSFGVAMSVACAVVILCVLFSLTVHFCYYTKSQLITHLIINLLVALLLSEITFLLASLLSPIADVAGCAAIGAILHYFMLVLFLWCFLIVTSLIFVIYFGAGAYEHLQLVLYTFFGWLTPGIVVLLTLLIVRFVQGHEWAEVYGDVHGNGDLCFIPLLSVSIVTAVVPIVGMLTLSMFGFSLLFLLTGTSSNEDLKYDDIYFTSKNTREVIKLLVLFIVIGLAWIFSAIHLIAGQLYLLIIAMLAQLALAVYIAVVYGGNVIYIFVLARRKSYYPQEDVNEMNASLSPVSPMNVDVSHALGPPSYMEDKIYANPSIPDASSIFEGSYPPSEVPRSSAMYTEDPEIDDLLYTLKVVDPDQESYFQNGDSRSETSAPEVFSKRRISIADTHL